mgnify:CR=1 FL=1
MVQANKKELILKNIPIIKHFASKYYIDDFNISYDTLLSSGMNGLLNAVDEYNIKSGVKFSLFASNNIKFQILKEIRRTSALSRGDVLQVEKYCEENLDKFYRINSDDASEYLKKLNPAGVIQPQLKNKCLLVYTAYLDDFLLKSEYVNLNELINVLNDGTKKLSYLEQLILYLYYKEELTYYQIEQVLNIPECSIFGIHTIALSKLRKLLKENSISKK